MFLQDFLRNTFTYTYIFTTAFRLTGEFVSTGLGKVEEETAEYTKSAEHDWRLAEIEFRCVQTDGLD